MLNPWIVDTIKSAARQELKDKDEKLLSELTKWIDLTLQNWKLEHGDRNPCKHEIRLLFDPVPIRFEDAEPWECAGLIFPSRLSLAMKLISENYPDFMTILEKTNYRVVLALLIEQVSTTGDDLFFAYDLLARQQANWQGQLAATVQHWNKIQTAETQKMNLDNGRIAGVRARQSSAKKNWDELDKAINDLFSENSKPGWQWNNNQITTYILKHYNVYAESTVKQRVKILASQHRKNRIRPENY